MNEVTFWQLSPTERLKEWRSFRISLQDLTIEEQVEHTVKWWMKTPIDRNTIDPYDSSNWPDPWQLIHSGKFDENAIALAMAYTLHYLGLECKVLLVQDQSRNLITLVTVIKEEYVINYNYGEVNKQEVLDNIEILNSWDLIELTQS